MLHRQFKIGPYLGICVFTSLVVAAVTTLSVHAIAQDDPPADPGCITVPLTCNETTKNPEPGFCGGAVTPCESYTGSGAEDQCPVTPNCNSLKGQYAETLAQDCVACPEDYREEGGDCDCIHCINAPAQAACVKTYRCRLVLQDPGKPKCVSDNLCSTSYDDHKIEVPCDDS